MCILCECVCESKYETDSAYVCVCMSKCVCEKVCGVCKICVRVSMFQELYTGV